MRVTYTLPGLLAASSAMATSYNPQHVVLGTDGTVVVGADPSLYFRKSRPSYLLEHGLELQDTIRSEADDLSPVMLPRIYHKILPNSNLGSSVQDEDEFSSSTILQDSASSVTWNAPYVDEDSDIPGVYGSVVFAELSCCFVAFIGYLVRSIPLWIGFSRGQRYCLIVAFSMALLYQFAALGWFFGVVTSELMLGLSSLITRMISLGMVPITTTSFMGRAREICQDPADIVPSVTKKSSHSRSARRHHARARSS